MPSGFVTVSLKDVITDEEEIVYSGKNNFTNTGKVDVANFILNNSGGSPGRLRLNVSYIDPVSMANNYYESTNYGIVPHSNKYADLTSSNSTYFKKYAETTTDTANRATDCGAWGRLSITNYSGIAPNTDFIMAFRNIRKNSIGRVWRHSSSWTWNSDSANGNIFYHSGYTGNSSNAGSVAVSGTFNPAITGSYYYTVNMRTSGPVGSAAYDICKTNLGNTFKHTVSEFSSGYRLFAIHAVNNYLWQVEYSGAFLYYGLSGERLAYGASGYSISSVGQLPSFSTNPNGNKSCLAFDFESDSRPTVYVWDYNELTKTMTTSGYLATSFGVAASYRGTASAITSGGDIYVGFNNNAGIFRQLSGASTWSICSGLSSIAVIPNGLAISKDGNYLYLCTSSSLIKYNFNTQTIDKTFTTSSGFTVTNCTVTSGSSGISTSTTNGFNINGVSPGMTVSGTGIQAGTIVAAVSGTTNLTLSQPSTASGTYTLTFIGSTIFSGITGTLFTAQPARDKNGAKIVAVDSSNTVWAVHNSANGVSSINSDGNAIVRHTTINASESSFVNYNDGLFSLTQNGIFIDAYDRPVVYCHSNGVANSTAISVYDSVRNSWSWIRFQGSTSWTMAVHTISCFPDNAYIWFMNGTDGWWRFVALSCPPLRYGWTGSTWSLASSGTKTTHSGAGALLDGLTVSFSTSGAQTFTANEWFSVAASPGIIKDNLQDLTFRYAWYTANLQYTQNESYTIASSANGVTLGKGSPDYTGSQNPSYLVCETLERDNWVASISGYSTNATFTTTTPTSGNQIQVNTSGTNTEKLSFHSNDIGKDLNISYYWLKY